MATSAAARLESVGLGEAFTGLGQQWQALFGRKPFPSLAGLHGPSAHIASPRLGQAWHAALLPGTARLGVLPHASPRSSAGQLGGGDMRYRPPPAHSQGRKPPQPSAGWPGTCCRGAGPGLQPRALSTQRGRRGRAWQGAGGLVLTRSGMCQEHPCLGTELPGSRAPAKQGSSPARQTLPDSNLGMAATTVLCGSGAGDPCSIPFPGLLGPAGGC